MESVAADMAQVLDGEDVDLPARKAIMQKLVAEVRVESRDSILPTFQVPLRTPVGLWMDWCPWQESNPHQPVKSRLLCL